MSVSETMSCFSTSYAMVMVNAYIKKRRLIMIKICNQANSQGIRIGAT